MSGVLREINDTVDASLEMPERDGSRPFWRYYQVRALIGLISFPILIVLSFLDGSKGLGRIAWIVGLMFIAAATVYFIYRDVRVQKRIDETGSPLVDQESY